MKQLKDAMKGLAFTEENHKTAAFSTFTGNWAKGKGFDKVKIVTKEQAYVHLQNIEDLEALEVIFSK